MQYNSLLELLVKGGYTIVVLLFCSILSIKVVIEKYISFKCLNENFIKDFVYRINIIIQKRDFEKAEGILDQVTFNWLYFKIKSPLADVFRFIIINRDMEKEDLLQASYTKIDIQLTKLEKRLNILGTLGGITPFIGLFGTVIGIIKAFEALSENLSFSYSNVMSGISEALISTAAGLFVAIPSVMFYNYFNRRIKNTQPLFDDAVQTIVNNIIKTRK